MTPTLIMSLLATFMPIMALAYGVQRLTRNSGWVDVIWTFATGFGAAFFLFAVAGFGWRTPLLAFLLVVWAGRLGGHIAARALKGGDDPRYADLVKQWGSAAPWRMFAFLQAQALASTVLGISVLAAALNPEPPSWLDGLALVVAIGSLVGEALADHQLKAAKAAGEALCERGLWAYSRHPNYFFEFLFWCALPLFALSGGGPLWPGALALLAPIQMYILLAHVSGVPPLEAHMLRRHGEAFRALSARVSVFFPAPRHTTQPPQPQRSVP